MVSPREVVTTLPNGVIIVRGDGESLPDSKFSEMTKNARFRKAKEKNALIKSKFKHENSILLQVYGVYRNKEINISFVVGDQSNIIISCNGLIIELKGKIFESSLDDKNLNGNIVIYEDNDEVLFKTKLNVKFAPKEHVLLAYFSIEDEYLLITGIF
jgi:hypothetical protein